MCEGVFVVCVRECVWWSVCCVCEWGVCGVCEGVCVRECVWCV